MCQPKSLGGKRCAIHHHGTQAAVQTTSIKTGVDTEDVKNVFSELNKEGKKLPEPSRSEYESYIEKERFMTEIDQTLPERDKKMILKKLEKAKEENTPSGGTFHAWKNLMTSTLQKFGKKTRLFVAGLGVAAIAFGSAGCSGPATSNISGSTMLDGATSISLVQGEQVTDELGAYSKLQLDSKNPLLTFDKNASYVDMSSVTAAGFTEADAAAAQKAAVTFAATEMFDNASADIPSTASQTFSNIAGQYVTGQYISKITNPASKIVYVQPDGVTFMRDGKPRISSMNAKLIEVAGTTYKSDGISAIDISGSTLTDYRVNSVGAGSGYKTAKVESYWTLRMVPVDGAWKILGYENSYTTELVK